MSNPGVASPEVRTLGLSWPLIVALLALFATLCLLPVGRSLLDPDIYWHLVAGQWILEHGAVPSVDLFSHTKPGAPWTAQEWLSEVIVALVHRAGGWSGMVVLAASSFALTLALLTRFLLARLEPIHALLCVSLAGLMMINHLLMRPHVLSWPLLALWVGTLVDVSERGRSPPWWLLLVMGLWANLHGGFTFGLALAGGLALDAFVSAPAGTRMQVARRWLAFIAAAVVVSMATPSGWHGIWFTVHLLRMDYARSLLDEWRSPDFHNFQALEVWLLFALAMAWAGRMTLPPVRLLLLLGLVHLALGSARGSSLLGVVSPLIVATPWARGWYRSGPVGGAKDAEHIDRWFRAFAGRARPATAALACGLALAALAVIVPARAPVMNPTYTPQAALAAARAAGVQGEVLNGYGFGAYLIFRGVKVFIDDRADFYGDDFLKRYVEALGLKQATELPRLLTEYRIGWTLLQPDTPEVFAMDHLPGWKRIHADDIAVVHMRIADDVVR